MLDTLSESVALLKCFFSRGGSALSLAWLSGLARQLLAEHLRTALWLLREPCQWLFTIIILGGFNLAPPRDRGPRSGLGTLVFGKGQRVRMSALQAGWALLP